MRAQQSQAHKLRQPTDQSYCNTMDESIIQCQQDKPQNQKLRKGEWCDDEHIKFLKCVVNCGVGKWKMIAQLLHSRTASQCQIHFYKLKQKLRINNTAFAEYAFRELQKQPIADQMPYSTDVHYEDEYLSQYDNYYDLTSLSSPCM